MLREIAQKWADEHGMQTLTTAMGPLMIPEHPLCLKSKKTPHAWSQYIHGASAIFAWHIARGECVTLLTPPPPDRFNPSGFTYYQVIEQPIIKGAVGQDSVCHIDVVHPTVKKAEEFSYELWPDDNKSTWIKRFGLQTGPRNWRATGQREEKLQLLNMMDLRDGLSHSATPSKPSSIKKVSPEEFADSSFTFIEIRGQNPLAFNCQNLSIFKGDGIALPLYFFNPCSDFISLFC
jgi:hypothetical protein